MGEGPEKEKRSRTKTYPPQNPLNLVPVLFRMRESVRMDEAADSHDEIENEVGPEPIVQDRETSIELKGVQVHCRKIATLQ